MSDSPQPTAGPSNEGNLGHAAAGGAVSQFVEAYLQSHGFDKALETYRQGFADAAREGITEGDDDATGRSRATLQGDAVFRAPGPISLEAALKRNLPQAMFPSASTMSDRITPEFEAQAKYIIDSLLKKNEANGGDGKPAEKGEMLLDPSDRIEGYRRYRRWVDDGLDLWKPELDGVSFPLMVYTFLDLMQADFTKAARDFLAKNMQHYQNQHPQELAALSSLGTRHHIEINPYCRRLLAQKYNIKMSRNSHDILLQWLSGAGLDEEWEMGRQTAVGRAKAAVHGIVVNRIRISVSDSHMPLDEVALASGTGLIPPLNTIGPQTPPSQLKLGPAPMTDKLKEQVSKTLQDEDEAAVTNGNVNGNDANAESAAQQNGHEANGDVEMSEPNGESSKIATREQSPTANEVKLEPDTHSDLISPAESETNPPVPGIFRIADLKREVEAVRDRRRMMRLGGGDEDKSTTPVLPSVLAMTVFDGGLKTSSLEFSHDSSLMAVGSSESCIRLWSLKGEKLKAKTLDSDNQVVEDVGLAMRKLIGHTGPVYSMSFDPIYGSAQKPSTLLSSSRDGTVRLWSMDTYTNLVAYRGHNRDPVWDVEWGPMGIYFASASRDRTAKLWSSDRTTPLRMYSGHLSDVNCVRFHPNSLYLATGSHDDTVRVWDVQRGACIRLFLGHTDAVTTLAFSPDGRTLASAGLDSSIYLWDLGSSRPIKKMTGHQGQITSLSFSAESSVLVSGSLDSTVRCWDVKSAGGMKSASMRNEAEAASRRVSGAVNNVELGELPLGPGRETWEEGTKQTSDLLATFHTKRTPIVKVHHTPRNMCMVGGYFVPPSNTSRIEEQEQE